MNSADVMRDPFYVPILHYIESAIYLADREAESKGMRLTDSQVRSILVKARKRAEGGQPKLDEGNARDAILAELYRSITHGPQALRVNNEKGPDEDLPLQFWLLSLKTVEDSVRARNPGAGSRGYLDFLRGWLPLPVEEPPTRASAEAEPAQPS